MGVTEFIFVGFALQTVLLVWTIVRDVQFRKKQVLDVERVNEFLPKLEEIKNVRKFLEDVREAMSAVENSRQTRERIGDFFDHVKNISELDLYKEDEILVGLLTHSGEMVEYLESFKEVYDFDEEWGTTSQESEDDEA
jgi:hypothetical protein